MNPILPNLADLSVLNFELWAFAFLRVITMVFLLPVIGGKQVPPQVKVGLALFLSLLIFPTLPETAISLPDTMPGLVFLALRELLVGLLMGFGASLIFTGLSLAGRMMDNASGLSMIQSINPMTEQNESAMGQFTFIIFSLLMLITGMHLFFVRIIAESFRSIPLLQAHADWGRLSGIFTLLIAKSLAFGLQLSLPIIVPILLATVALAIVARIMPQMNVWLVGMPLNIGLALVTLFFVMPLLWMVFKRQVEYFEMNQLAILRLLGA